MAFKVKLPTVFLGAVYTQDFLWSSEDDAGVRTPVDLTGLEGRIQLRKKAGSPPYADWSTVNGCLSLSGNRISIHVPATLTDTYTFTEAEFDLLVWPASDKSQAELVVHGTVEGKRVITDV